MGDVSDLVRGVVDRWRAMRIESEDELAAALDGVMVSYAYNSGRMEDPNITYSLTHDIFFGERVSSYTGSLRTLYEVHGAKRAHELFLRAFGARRPLDADLIKDFHRELTLGTYDARRAARGELSARAPSASADHDPRGGALDVSRRARRVGLAAGSGAPDGVPCRSDDEDLGSDAMIPITIQTEVIKMDRAVQDNFISVLRMELVPALGCTEPIAIAYAAAKAREVLGDFPESIDVRCSGNIIKNVKGVAVPNAEGMRGVGTAAVLGVVGGVASRELEVLEEVTHDDVVRTKELLDTPGFFTHSLERGVANLYIKATVRRGEHTASVTIVNKHTNITEITHDGRVIFSAEAGEGPAAVDWSPWSLAAILDFARTVDIAEVRDILDAQIEMNSAISREGLDAAYGARVGRTLLDDFGTDVKVRAAAAAAAGSDARMGGCSLPVVINSGSGNQGITVSMPVIEYVHELGVSDEMRYRALLISNLISIYQKHYIGSLSAFCGAVTASAGAAAAIAYLHGDDDEVIGQTIVNTLGNVGGIVCDGAKSSCAAKIASSVTAGLMGWRIARAGRGFQPGEGIVLETAERTIQSVGYMGRVGMAETDIEILGIMVGSVDPSAR